MIRLFVWALGGALAPTSVLAQDAALCVSSTAPTGAGRCSRCDQPAFVSFSSALAAAAALPDVNGAAPSVSICLDSPGMHSESLVIDNSGGRLGLPLTLQLAGASLCPDPASAEDQPLIRWTASPGSAAGVSDTLSGLESDMRGPGCSASRPGIELRGWDALAVAGARTFGTVGYAAATGVTGGGDLIITDSSLMDVRGAAILAGGFVNVMRTEIVGGWVGGEGGARGLVATFGGGAVSLRSSIIHGNVADGTAAGVQGLLVGQVWLNNSTVSNNTVARAPLAVLAYGGRGFSDPDRARGLRRRAVVLR